MTTRTASAEMSATDFRQNISRVLTDAEYGHPTTITREGRPVARIVHPDAANIPGSDVWQAAQQAWEHAVGGPAYGSLPADACRAVDALGELLATYYGHGGQT